MPAVAKSAIVAVTSQEGFEGLYGKVKPPSNSANARRSRLAETGSEDPPPPVVVALQCGDREERIVIPRGVGWHTKAESLCTAYGAPFELGRDRYEIPCVVKDGELVPRVLYEKLNQSQLGAIAQLCEEKGLVSRVILCQCKAALAFALWAREAAERFPAYESMRTLVGPVFSRNFVMMSVLRSVLALARPVRQNNLGRELAGELGEAYARAAEVDVELPAVSKLRTLNFEGDEYRRVLDAQVAGIETKGATVDIFVLYGANGTRGSAFGIVDGVRDDDGNLMTMQTGLFLRYRLLLEGAKSVVSTPEDLQKKLEELTVCTSPIHENPKSIFNLKYEVVSTEARQAGAIIAQLFVEKGGSLTPELKRAFRMCIAGAGESKVQGALQLRHVCSVLAHERALVTSESSQEDHKAAEKEIHQALVKESAARRQTLESNIMQLWARRGFRPDLELAKRLILEALDERVEVQTSTTVGWAGPFENCEVACAQLELPISVGYLGGLRSSGKSSADGIRARRVDDEVRRKVDTLEGYSQRPRIAELPGGFGGQANGVPHHGGAPGGGQGVAAAMVAQLQAAGAAGAGAAGVAAAVAAAGGGPPGGPGGGPPGGPPGGGLGPMPAAAATSGSSK